MVKIDLPFDWGRVCSTVHIQLGILDSYNVCQERLDKTDNDN